MTHRPVSTYSIVARDPQTGELGVAVQSHWFSVGTVVSWAEAGVGAVATQSLADPAYGPRGLGLMRAGWPAQRSLDSLLADDEGRERRQVAFVDSQGEVAVHTGSGCIAEAGHRVGKQMSVQANMMDRNTVWNAMAAAYDTATGDLVERLLAALEAAESEGGDIRGKQSAALLVVKAESTGEPWNDRIFDLRVEDHSNPVVELRRLVGLRQAYLFMEDGDEAMGREDMDSALEHYTRAENLVPEIVEMPFWKAVALVSTGQVEESLPIFTDVFEREPVWKELITRIADVGLLEADQAVIDLILDC